MWFIRVVRIPFIYADKCEHCQEALSVIEGAILKCKNITCEIAKFKYDTKAALAIAVAQGIDDLPGFVIGSEVFVGDDYDEERIIKAIKKASKI
jgi:hypothetical protein